MICKNCGADNDDSVQTCKVCGEPLAEASDKEGTAADLDVQKDAETAPADIAEADLEGSSALEALDVPETGGALVGVDTTVYDSINSEIVPRKRRPLRVVVPVLIVLIAAGLVASMFLFDASPIDAVNHYYNGLMQADKTEYLSAFPPQMGQYYYGSDDFLQQMLASAQQSFFESYGNDVTKEIKLVEKTALDSEQIESSLNALKAHSVIGALFEGAKISAGFDIQYNVKLSGTNNATSQLFSTRVIKMNGAWYLDPLSSETLVSEAYSE